MISKPSLAMSGALSLSPSGETPRGSLPARRSPKSPKKPNSGVSRPDDVTSLASMTMKRKGTASEIARPGGNDVPDAGENLVVAKVKSLTTPSGETGISKKEEALEQIMCAEAYAGFERMARHQLNRNTANRTAVDPTKAGVDMDALAHLYLDGSDVAEPDSDSDDEMTMKYNFTQWNAGAGEDLLNCNTTYGLNMGFGFTIPSELQVPQDRVFSSRCGTYTLMGIINSHGVQDAGWELANFIAKELPSAFFKSPWLTQEDDPVTALSHAFDRTHRKASKAVDCRLTGSCCTVLLLGEEEVFIAHVGNCRAVLAVPDPNMNAQKYHFIPVPLTVDHKLSVRAEFDRVLEYGGEIRRCVNDNVHRLFFKDGYVPGLTLTRGIGHRMAHPIGVSHIPSIQVLQRSEMHKDAFIVLGSGGIWNAMSERGVVNWVGQHFADPREAAESLGNECKRRWEDPSSRLKAFVQEAAGESFSSMIVYPGLDQSAARGLENGGPATHAPRQFQLGPHGTKVARREWKDVSKANWKQDLACIMNGSRPAREKDNID